MLASVLTIVTVALLQW